MVGVRRSAGCPRVVARRLQTGTSPESKARAVDNVTTRREEHEKMSAIGSGEHDEPEQKKREERAIGVI